MNKNIIQTLPWALIAVFAAASLNAQPDTETPGGPNFDQPVEFLGKSHKGDFHHRAGKRPDPGHRLLDMSERLQLTDEQEIQILKLSQHFRSEMDSIRESAKSVHETLESMRKNKAFDEEALREAMAEIQPTMVEGMVLRAKYRESLDDILTEEQKSTVETMKANLKKRAERNPEGWRNRSAKGNRPREFEGPRGS